MPAGITERGNPVDDRTYKDYLDHVMERQINGMPSITYDEWYTMHRKPMMDNKGNMHKMSKG